MAHLISLPAAKLLISLLFAFNSFVAAQSLPVLIESESGILVSDFEIVSEHGVTYVRPSTDLMNPNFPCNETKIITFNVPCTEAGYKVREVDFGKKGYTSIAFL